MRIEEYMKAGQDVFDMRPNEVEAMLNPIDSMTRKPRSLSREEFDGFFLGALDAIEAKLQVGDTRFVQKFMSNRAWQENMIKFLGPEQAKIIRSRLAREAFMQRSRNAILSGSRTAPLQESINGMTDGEPELDFLREVVSSGGDMKSPIMRRLVGIFDRLRRPGVYDENINREIATQLYRPATEGNVNSLTNDVRQYWDTRRGNRSVVPPFVYPPLREERE